MEHKYSGAVCKLLSPKHMQEVIFTFPQGLNRTVRDDVRKNVQSCADIHLYILASSPGTAASFPCPRKAMEIWVEPGNEATGAGEHVQCTLVFKITMHMYTSDHDYTTLWQLASYVVLELCSKHSIVTV